MNDAQRMLDAALAAERRGLSRLMQGEDARPDLRAARDAYLASYTAAKPGSWGRLIGALKAAVLAGEGAADVAARADREAADAATPPAAYLRSLAATALGRAPVEEDLVLMRSAGGAYGPTAAALAALGAGDAEAYAAAAADVLAGFAGREGFVSGVAVADTAVVLERLAAARGLAAGLAGPLMPPLADAG